MSEEELILALKEGKSSAFKYLVELHQDRVVNTCIGLVQNYEDAEDLAQEVFCEVFESIAGFKAESKISTWIYRISITKSLDFLRKKKRKKRFAFLTSIFSTQTGALQHDIQDFSHPGVLLENKEKAEILFKAISRLPEKQKVAFTLFNVEGLSYAETAEVLNTSIAAIESLMHRAKMNLREILENDYKNKRI